MFYVARTGCHSSLRHIDSSHMLVSNEVVKLDVAYLECKCYLHTAERQTDCSRHAESNAEHDRQLQGKAQNFMNKNNVKKS